MLGSRSFLGSRDDKGRQVVLPQVGHSCQPPAQHRYLAARSHAWYSAHRFDSQPCHRRSTHSPQHRHPRLRHPPSHPPISLPSPPWSCSLYSSLSWPLWPSASSSANAGKRQRGNATRKAWEARKTSNVPFAPALPGSPDSAPTPDGPQPTREWTTRPQWARFTRRACFSLRHPAKYFPLP